MFVVQYLPVGAVFLAALTGIEAQLLAAQQHLLQAGFRVTLRFEAEAGEERGRFNGRFEADQPRGMRFRLE